MANAPFANGADVEGGVPFALPGRQDREPVNLRFSGLKFEVGTKGKTTKQILKGLSGTLRPGELTAIMGPSGAGKSTFMNVLAGRAPYGRPSGTISLNGEAVDPVQYRKSLAYVMQEDALFSTQTPRECLHFTAALKLPDLSPAEREELVESVITALGLTKCADTLIGSIMIPGLSGGEKKRTAVAVELISSPSLIFLDEPTSGLDSHSAFELVKNLRALAEAGCTIICTIHQPSSEVFDMFHKVMLLRSGSMVYNGPVSGITDHFATIGAHCKPNYNPADFAMHELQVLSDAEVEPLIQALGTPVKQGSELDGMSIPTLKVRSAGFFMQLALLTKREMMQFIRDKDNLIARYGMCTMLSLLIGIIFWNAADEWGEENDPADIEDRLGNHWGAITFFSINAMFLCAQPMLLTFPIERPVFMREYTSGAYGTIPYMFAKTLVEVPAAFCQCLLATLVMYFMVSYNGNFVYLVASSTILGVVSASIALVLGASSGQVETVVNTAPAIYIPQILFSGFFISADSIPVWIRWVQWICPLKYGLNLATISEFARSAVPDNRESTVDALLERSDAERADWWLYVLIMLSLFFFFRIVAASLLAYKARDFQ